MSYELELLDRLITLDAAPGRFDKLDLDEDTFKQHKITAQKELLRIKAAFRMKVLSCKKEKQIELYVQAHQKELIRLSDQLLSYFPNKKLSISDFSGGSDLFSLYKHYYEILEDLLTHIEYYFSKYFNDDLNVPDHVRTIAIQNMQGSIRKLEEIFLKREANARLIEVSLQPLKYFISGQEQEAITFRALNYLKNQLQELQKQAATGLTGLNLNKKIIYALSYLNYNSRDFLDYCTWHIKQNYQKFETLTEQLEYLALMLKKINQSQVKPGFIYNPENHDLKYCLLIWITEETLFLEKRQQLSFEYSSQNTVDIAKKIKLHTDLSVSQLALLIKVMMDNKIILNKNNSEVLKLFATITRTKKAENISQESLRSKFYNVESGTRKAVSDLLLSMLKEVRNN